MYKQIYYKSNAYAVHARVKNGEKSVSIKSKCVLAIGKPFFNGSIRRILRINVFVLHIVKY